jgi:hypothetical protein
MRRKRRLKVTGGVGRIASIFGVALVFSLALLCLACQHSTREHFKADCDVNAVVQQVRIYVFSRYQRTDGITSGIVDRDRGYAFASMDSVMDYNHEARRIVHGSAENFELADSPIESPFWWATKSPEGANEFLRSLAQALSSLGECSGERIGGRPHTLLEKALNQRDLLQALELILLAQLEADDKGAREVSIRPTDLIARALRACLLSEAEYRALLALRPRRVSEQFSTDATFSLLKNYLPERVVSEDLSWLEIRSGDRPFRHYLAYGGRSFVKVYIKAPGESNEALRELWTKLYNEHGVRLHAESVVENTPAGMETMLVRTFGVFVTDGTFRDSTWPEEVTMRIFKYARPQLDMSTSDFRGTLFFRYVLSRTALLADSSSLGLVRRWDDEREFLGFMGDVPDRQHAISNVVTTMRSNCIGCHSILFYGLSTVFSFERDPQRRPSQVALQPSLAAQSVVDRPTPNELADVFRLISGKSPRQAK